VRNIHIELGTHRGRYCFPKFQTLVAQNKNIIIYGFEASDRFIKQGKYMEKALEGCFHFINQAAWIENGEKTLYLATASVGSSFFSTKKGIVPGSQKTVKCIDFSQWLSDNFKKEDHIVLAMDIEGSEYDVLCKMIDDDTISLIDKLIVEFHSYRKIGDQRIHKLYPYLLDYLNNHPVELEIMKKRT
tara:strand:- start:126 stop:686 length:561 start_codon:yes stop_codon:yes gene_type:complete